MLIYFYKSYKYAPKATNLSGLGMGMTVLGLICGAICICGYFGVNEKLHSVGFLILGIVLLVMACAGYFWIYRKVAPAVAEKEFPANLSTNVNVAWQYVRDNPHEYGRICSINPAFAHKYIQTEDGKLKKRK